MLFLLCARHKETKNGQEEKGYRNRVGKKESEYLSLSMRISWDDRLILNDEMEQLYI